MSEMKTVDSYRFLDAITRKLVESWIALEQPRAIPWTPLAKPLSECTVALVSTAGLALKTDRPFDQEGERQNPWWGDPTYRVLPRTTTGEETRICHLHVNPRLAEKDLNTLFPLQWLRELEELGEIGGSAARHYSFMGYNLQPQTLLEESTPAIIRLMKRDGVDAVILIPV